MRLVGRPADWLARRTLLRARSPHCGEQGNGLPHSRAIACQSLDHPACSPVKRVRVQVKAS